jgi:hypothetical protein
METVQQSKGVNMKKIAGKIAVILIFVLLAGSFMGCLSYVNRNEPTLNRVLYGVVDIIFLPISVIALIVYLIVTQENQSYYLANLDNNLLMDQNSLLSNYQKMNSLPEVEHASLMRILNSIPQAECNSTMEKFTSLSETQLVMLVKAYNSLPESVIISSIERINSLPEAELVSILRNFNSLTETELNSIIEEINPRSEMENATLADSSPEMDFVFSIEAVEAKPVTIVNVL